MYKTNYFCVCGHKKYQHRNNVKKTIRDYNIMPIEKRRHPLQWYLDSMKRLDLEYPCGVGGIFNPCECAMFKLDNLKYLETKSLQITSKCDIL